MRVQGFSATDWEIAESSGFAGHPVECYCTNCITQGRVDNPPGERCRFSRRSG